MKNPVIESQQRECILTEVFDSADDAARLLAAQIVTLIRANTAAGTRMAAVEDGTMMMRATAASSCRETRAAMKAIEGLLGTTKLQP